MTSATEPAQAEWRLVPDCRPQFGLVAFEDDPVSVPTLYRLLDPIGIDVQPARIAFPTVDADGSAMVASLRAAAATILPSEAPAAIGFACTTGAVRIGIEQLNAAVARPGARIEAVTPVDSVIASLRSLGAQRVAIVSPYSEATSQEVAEHIERCGFAVSALSWFDASNAQIPHISAASIVAAAHGVCAKAPCDALFLSCTGMRATPLVSELEASLGVAVLTSLQVMAWRSAGLLGVHASGPGRLFGTL